MYSYFIFIMSVVSHDRTPMWRNKRGLVREHVSNMIVVCLLLVSLPSTTGNTTSTYQITGAGAGEGSTHASPQNDTSGVTNGQTSSATDCLLTVPPDEKADVEDKLQGLFENNAVFIYVKLKFTTPIDVSDVFSNSSNIIDPETWVWAVEGKGELLLSYPFDFEQLSLGTLSLGVVTLEVPVGTPPDGCFQEANDDDKQRILARFLRDFTMETMNGTISEFYEDKGAKVCLEKQQSDDFQWVGVYGIPICVYYVFQGSTLYECWGVDEDPFEANSTLVRKHGWQWVILTLGLILALFSPLAASFFIRKQQPITKDGKKYVALNADLPLGLKYLLCFSFQEYPAVVAFRWFTYVALFMTIPFIPYIVSYATSGDAFLHRLDVAYELLVSRGLVILWFILINMIFLTTAMLFLGLYLYDETFVPNSLEVKEDDRTHFGAVVPMPKTIHVPSRPSSSETPLHTFMYTMWHRTQMAIDPATWAFFFSPIWNFIYGLLGGRKEDDDKNRCRIAVTFIVFIIVFPFALVVFLFFLLLNSVPLIYMVTWTVSKCLSEPFKCIEVIVAFMAMFLSFSILFIFVAAFVYIAELIGYTFIGFVLNSDFAGPVLVVIITVVGYLITAATDFYDKYCILLKVTIETAEQVDKERAKRATVVSDNIAPHSPAAVTSETEIDATDAGPTDQETVELQSMEENRPMVGRKLVEYENDVPIIPLHLFNLVIAKYQPIYLAVARILFQLLIIAVVVAFGLATIIFIDAVNDLPATVEFFATVVVAGVVPVLMQILKSPGKQENDDEAKARHLEADLEYYAEEENFEKLVL